MTLDGVGAGAKGARPTHDLDVADLTEPAARVQSHNVVHECSTPTRNSDPIPYAREPPRAVSWEGTSVSGVTTIEPGSDVTTRTARREEELRRRSR